MSNLSVGVIGAGIVGLSTAAVVQRQFPSVELTIFADNWFEETTSSVAAGYFLLNERAPVSDRRLLLQIARDSGDHFCRLATSADGPAAGVNLTSVLELQQNDATPKKMEEAAKEEEEEEAMEEPVFSRFTFGSRRVSLEELRRRVPPEAVDEFNLRGGFETTTAFAECRLYLPYLLRRLRATSRSLRLRRRRLAALQEAGDCSLLFNCSGLGAGGLCNDLDVYPIRGQVVRVQAPWQKVAVHGAADTYVLPNTSSVVLGGTYLPGQWDTRPRPEDTMAILRRAARLVPSISTAKVVREAVGLRPGRRGGLRLEVQRLQSGQTVVHNYGHGAHGIGLSWGSACAAVQLATDAMRAGAGQISARL